MPPPINLIRNTKFLDMLINYFFELNSKPNQEHKSKYSYLLAYASSGKIRNFQVLYKVKLKEKFFKLKYKNISMIKTNVLA